MQLIRSSDTVTRAPLQLALAGSAALLISQGIGRFAFTPLLPLMLNEKIIDLPSGSLLASANYVGYLVGAMMVAAQPWAHKRFGLKQPLQSSVIRWGLVAMSVLTAAMAWPAQALWLPLRFLAGVVSAYVMIFTSGWCLAHLALQDRTSMSGIVFTGPGTGIMVSGLIIAGLVSQELHSEFGWFAFGAVSAVLMTPLWRIFQGNDPHRQATQCPSGSLTERGRIETILLVVAYGLGGFGYIITATFLPVIARSYLSDTVWIDLFWPIFGLGTVLGAVLSFFVSQDVDRRSALVGAYALQTIGVGLSLVMPSLWGFVIGSFLAGLPFAATTLFVMQEARRFRPKDASALMGLLTAAFGIGQVAGPLLVAALLVNAASQERAFFASLAAASGVLMVVVLMFLLMTWLWPMPETTRTTNDGNEDG